MSRKHSFIKREKYQGRRAFKFNFISEWLNTRTGRRTALARLIGEDVKRLSEKIEASNIDAVLMAKIMDGIDEINKKENYCLMNIGKVQDFLRLGCGREMELAKELGLSVKQIRTLRDAEKDQRYLLMKHGTDEVLRAILKIKKTASYYKDLNASLVPFLNSGVMHRTYSIHRIEEMADNLKKYANFGNHDVAFVLKKLGEDSYSIVNVGVDYNTEELRKSHVCDDLNPHMHAIRSALIRSAHKMMNGVDYVVYGHTAPCTKCASTAFNMGVSAFFCRFRPDEMGGLEFLRKKGVSVELIQYLTKEIVSINKESCFKDAS